MRIIKRSGEEQEFNPQKISVAIGKANDSVPKAKQFPKNYIPAYTAQAVAACENLSHTPTVQEVQDIVEDVLMNSGHHEVARSYIKYRYTHDAMRQHNTTDDKILALIEYKNEEVKQENSNKNPQVVSVQRDYMAGEVSKDLTMRMLLPKDIVEAHNAGIIHFHDADYYSQHMHNCFTGGTKFVTDKGIMSFRDAHDGETLYVMAMDGQMRKATVHKYGERSFNLVNLKCGRMTHHVYCTPDHRWILKDGSVTTDLKVGDKLYALQDASSYEIKTKEDAEAFCIGFAVGDGCDLLTDSESRSGGLRIRLCGDKTKYSDYFQMAGYSIQNIQNSSDMVAYKRCPAKQDFLNGKAWRFMSLRNKALAFHGLYAADGAKANNLLCTTDERVCLFIEETSSIAGYHISSTREDVRDTNYKKGSYLFAYHFVKHNLPNILWTVTSIEKNRRTGEAWCVEEPVTHSFTLEKGIVTGNCDLLNLDDMLQNGTVISGTLIERPHRFSTACNIATQIIAQVASCQYGGQSISLTHLAKFVDVSRKAICKEVDKENEELHLSLTEYQRNQIVDGRLRKEVRAGIQTIQYQVITLMTTNGQAPFITVFMYLNEAGKDEVLKHDLAMCIEEMLHQRYEGVKNEVGVYITPAFPKLIYVLEDDNIQEGQPFFYLTKMAAKCTARRMVPDYISEKKMREYKLSKGETEGNGDVYTCMGCRSFLTPDRSGNGWDNIANAKNYDGKPKYYGRFNQGVVTINLVDVALSADKDEETFWRIFDERLELCHRALQCRHKRLKGTLSDVAPILWQYGALARLKKGETIDKLLYNGYSTISLGYAGLYECCMAMYGKSHTDPAVKPFALKVMQHMNDKCNEWKAAENIDYSLYGTPLESTTYKFAKCLQKRFGIIKDVTDHEYITNSYHVNVREKIDAFSKLAFESEFQKLSPGGAISYIEVPNMQDNLEAVIAVMRFIYDHIMYAELNTKSDYCHVCGYDGEIQIVKDNGKLVWECPHCHNRDQHKMNVARRTCGYIGTQYWNQGRTQEIAERVTHL